MEPPATLDLLLDIVHLSHELRLTFNGHIPRRVGLSLEHAVALCRIELNGGEITVSGLAAELRRATHSVSALLDKLERQGLVSRHRKPDADRRQVWISLTPEGGAKLQLFRDALPDLFLQVFGRSLDQQAQQIAEAIAFLSNLFDRSE